MGSRIAAAVIVLAGVAMLAWVAFGDSTDETASTPAPIAAVDDEAASPDAAPSDPVTATESEVDADDAPAAEPAPAEPAATSEPAIEVPENLGPRMDLVNLDGWLNTDATSIDDFNGKLLLVEMWTFGCHNCKARIPFNQSYYEEFADENFEIIGVHAPEFSHEADIDNIKEALVRLGVDWPVALDTSKKNFRSWQPGSTNFWPRTFVIDQNGDIRYDHIGEGRYEELRETLRFLLANPPPPSPAT